jgi:hypothetical protein
MRFALEKGNIYHVVFIYLLIGGFVTEKLFAGKKKESLEDIKTINNKLNVKPFLNK